ncbi:transposase [Streptomyces sp. NPDC017940]|uniref:IS110 family transposase n=1 Tax=Streptomyces sp. NPDC017940 TaxID=3365017 RepID=UPI0037A766EA
MAAPETWAGVGIGRGDRRPGEATVVAAGTERRERVAQARRRHAGAIAGRAVGGVSNRGRAAFLLGLLASHDQRINHITGLAVQRASVGHRSQAKTDTKDAFTIDD